MNGVISKDNLRRARPENVRRLAKFMKLKTEGMKDKQVIDLVWWRLKKRQRPELCNR